MSRLATISAMALAGTALGCDLSLTATTACGIGDDLRPPLAVSSGQSFRLGLGETAVVVETCLRVRFDAVPEDSRCAIDVVCPWAGNARIALTVTSADGMASALELNTLLDPRAGSAAGHVVSLLDLSPLPETGRPIPPEEVHAKLRIEAP